MFRKIMIITLCFLLLFVSACSQTPVPQTTDGPGDSPAGTETPEGTEAPADSPEPSGDDADFDTARISDMLVQTEFFSVTLLQNLKNAYTDQNTLFSPLAFNTATAALYAAAGGDTEEELRVMMGYLTEPADTVETLKYLISAIDSDHFTLGNSLHLSKRVGFSESFIDNVTTALRIGTYSQDYADLATFQAINACAEMLTNGRVSTILESTAAADTLYLLTAFNLNGSFDLSFDPSDTKSATFEASTGLVSTQMMNGDFVLGYSEDEYMQSVSLPMNNGAMQMKLVLPRAGGYSAFDEAFIQYADAWLGSENETKQLVSLSLPKFTLSTGVSYLEVLSSMGLNNALRAQTVDFTAMLNPDLVLPTPINDLFSVASLIIDENGVNADPSEMPAASEPSEESIELIFDRPFLVAITDTQSGALLAMGWVNTVNESR